MSPGPARRLVPSYLATGGVNAPEHSALEELTALTGTGRSALPHHTPAHQRLLDLVSDGGLTVMEIAGYLRLPVGVVKMLAAQLVSDGHLRAAAPLPDALAPRTNAGRPSRALLEEVMHGLLAL
ncbi:MULTISPECIES: DUF742 domain-containing protein [unclassified Streptomyces]|uniref:DUF742 domain-containing protein n=1 Tax=unclassified Streptomyces TaxID=2593676 RepID=UPI000F704319|nr:MULTISPECIES: DUF742 domain-containing protein [unclassified Streptomyces]AZM64056.1 hypothetical protein DLM49_34805 [Streptomyces sp. WAC 01438]RSM88146.1 hypothetical protein DMA10_34370 [Streptomyces sp. WAC 01420]